MTSTRTSSSRPCAPASTSSWKSLSASRNARLRKSPPASKISAPRCPVLTVGFNRRFAPGTARLKSFFAGATPLSISYRFAPPFHSTRSLDAGPGNRRRPHHRRSLPCHRYLRSYCRFTAGQVFAESAALTGDLQTSDDRVFITIRHRNGSISSVSYQAGGDAAFPGERIEVIASGRSATLDAWEEGRLWTKGRCEKFSAAKESRSSRRVLRFPRGLPQRRHGPSPWDDLYGVTWASLARRPQPARRLPH